jgi:decaprenyl-phosphate phosphoribosyltransferase
MYLRRYLICIRPQHWTKNLLIFAAPFTAGSFSNFAEIKQLLYLFLIFCAASSTIYVLNDWVDRDFDSKHSQKMHRPFAAKEIGSKSLIFLLSILLLIQVVVSFLIPHQLLLWVIAYLVIAIAYSTYFKQVAVLEMFLVAIGYILRALAGAAAINVEASSWFLIVVGFGALFLVANKRLAEISHQNSTLTREVIIQYSNSFLRMIAGSSMTICLTGYTLWAFQYSSVTQISRLSIMVFALALMRYLWLSDRTNAERPEVILFTDKYVGGLGIVLIILMSKMIY